MRAKISHVITSDGPTTMLYLLPVRDVIEEDMVESKCVCMLRPAVDELEKTGTSVLDYGMTQRPLRSLIVIHHSII